MTVVSSMSPTITKEYTVSTGLKLVKIYTKYQYPELSILLCTVYFIHVQITPVPCGRRQRRKGRKNFVSIS